MAELEPEPSTLCHMLYQLLFPKGGTLKLHPDLLLDHACLRAGIAASLSFPSFPSSGAAAKSTHRESVDAETPDGNAWINAH